MKRQIHRYQIHRYSGLAGFTLIELMITIAVLSILISLAVPSYRYFTANQRVKTAAMDLMIGLNYTRSEAIKRNLSGGVFIKANGNWQDGWILTTNNAKTYADCEGNPTDAECLKIYPAQGKSAITGGSGWINYGRSGRADISGGIPAGGITFTVCDNDPGVEVNKRQVHIDPSGRARIVLLDEKCS